MVKTHISGWFIFLFVAMLIVPALMSPDMSRARLLAEHSSSVSIFGGKKVESISQTANDVYSAVIGGLGIEDVINSGYVKKKDIKDETIAKRLNTDMSTLTNRYLESLTLQIYGIFFRGALMVNWLLYVGLFLFAAIFDGVAQRQVKQETIQMVSPIKFAIATHTVVAILFIPLAYLVLPINVTPWFMPIWAVVVALPLAKAIANAAKTG
jgi:mannose/fructose/N-acetylgalactosamine-specific phosphotransferase system component IIB